MDLQADKLKTIIFFFFHKQGTRINIYRLKAPLCSHNFDVGGLNSLLYLFNCVWSFTKKLNIRVFIIVGHFQIFASQNALPIIYYCWLEEIAHGKTILNPKTELSNNHVP